MTARIGLIIPSSNRMVEHEMVPAFPAGVQAHVTRLRMTGGNRMPLSELLPHVEVLRIGSEDALQVVLGSAPLTGCLVCQGTVVADHLE